MGEIREFRYSFDAALKELQDMMRRDKEREEESGAVWVRNEERIAEVEEAYNAIKEHVLEVDSGADIEINFEQDFGMVVSVAIRSCYLEFDNMQELAAIILSANNIDIVGHTDGIVEIGISFDGCFTEMVPKSPQQRRADIWAKNTETKQDTTWKCLGKDE